MRQINNLIISALLIVSCSEYKSSPELTINKIIVCENLNSREAVYRNHGIVVELDLHCNDSDIKKIPFKNIETHIISTLLFDKGEISGKLLGSCGTNTNFSKADDSYNILEGGFMRFVLYFDEVNNTDLENACLKTVMNDELITFDKLDSFVSMDKCKDLDSLTARIKDFCDN